ncbi:amino acid ABC transporter ATP-binding protein [Rhizobium leguminosarum]|uniref:amino acid ABC transporter ATP-binding protein n=1 Tax=Rhizobium leguminosarum TaxID=384 RepID=UPI00143FB5F1|nr:amino acid ABC transporter ATP-binding protein [Rhizobium leguminosarum]NKL21264.1 ATP-binding cassette domain-containing protein [Rhizobium leguminosarum bv. viciae]NKL56771.1 ATP-binding cassette domain-containing protein [Rhizobium leguminosarum bv. viciae]
MNQPLLRIENLKKSYGILEVLKDISLSLEQGRCTAVIGPSGSGKTTMLRCINYLEVPTAGHIYLAGELIGERKQGDRYISFAERQLAPQRLEMGFVFQNFYLWPHLSVIENVALAPWRIKGMKKDDAFDLARQALEKVHMAHKAEEYPERLSGGQQQRVGIARALAQQPKIILFDEPTSALDPELVGEVLSVIGELADEGRSMVLVTHEIRFARDVAHEVIFMDGGLVVEKGAPSDVIGKPAHERTKKFLSQFHAG